MSRSSAWMMLASDTPLVQLPVMFASSKPSSGFCGEISLASTSFGQLVTRTFEKRKFLPSGKPANHSRAANAGLHIYAKSSAGHLAMFNPNVANAAGRFAADADAGKASPVQSASGDEHVLRRFSDARAVQAATGFEADGIVARVNIAAFNADVLAGINVNAVATAIDVHVFDHDIGAVSRVSRPIAALRDGKTFPANVVAGDWLKHDNTARILRRGDGGISFDATRPDDSSMVNVR